MVAINASTFGWATRISTGTRFFNAVQMADFMEKNGFGYRGFQYFQANRGYVFLDGVYRTQFEGGRFEEVTVVERNETEDWYLLDHPVYGSWAFADDAGCLDVFGGSACLVFDEGSTLSAANTPPWITPKELLLTVDGLKEFYKNNKFVVGVMVEVYC